LKIEAASGALSLAVDAFFLALRDAIPAAPRGETREVLVDRYLSNLYAANWNGYGFHTRHGDYSDAGDLQAGGTSQTRHFNGEDRIWQHVDLERNGIDLADIDGGNCDWIFSGFYNRTTSDTSSTDPITFVVEFYDDHPTQGSLISTVMELKYENFDEQRYTPYRSGKIPAGSRWARVYVWATDAGSGTTRNVEFQNLSLRIIPRESTDPGGVPGGGTARRRPLFVVFV
jgi:hypothetical protein